MITLAQIVMIFVMLLVTKRSGATCNTEQKYRCRRTAEEGHSETVPGSGQCIVKQYVQFTHVCTVSNYVPSIDYCCCSHHQSQVMCCRYHQDWHHFRCVEADDTINVTAQSESTTIAWEQLLLIALSMVVVGGCCVLYCVTCLCRRRHQYNEYADDNNLACCSSDKCPGCCNEGMTSPSNDVRKCKTNAVSGAGVGFVADRTVSQTTSLLSTSCPVYRHHRYPQRSTRLPPSAPPSTSTTCSLDDVTGGCQLLPLVASSTRTFWHQPQSCGQHMSDVIVRVDAGTDGRPRCSACAITTSFPPPPYDESLYQRKMAENEQSEDEIFTTLPGNETT